MSYIIPDRELFDRGVLIEIKHNKDLHVDLEGLYLLHEGKLLCEGESIVPCVYKKILSYRNGFARAINVAGMLVYVNNHGMELVAHEFPFVPELCEDFDETGNAEVVCLVEGVFMLKGTMDAGGIIQLSGFNTSSEE